MRPGEVLDAQIDLLDRLTDPTNTQFKRSVAVVAAHHIGNMPTPDRPTKAQAEAAEKVIEGYYGAPPMLANHVRAAYAYRVTHDMCLMVEWMASQLEDLDSFHHELLPSGCGLVCFDKPLPVKDVRGKTMLVHWLMWGPGEFLDSRTRSPLNGTVFWHFNDTWRQPDEVYEYFKEEFEAENPEEGPEAFAALNRAQGRWATVGMEIVYDDQRLGPREWTPSNPQQIAEIKAEGFEPLPGTNSMRYVQALMMLLGQTITEVADDEVPRPFRRRAVKKRIPPKVSVVRLRRKKAEGMEPGESLVEWSHRWIVRQHLRWQPYGHRKGLDHAHAYGPVEVQGGHLVRYCLHHDCDGTLRRIVINPYEKGPAGAPLLITEKVYSLEQ